MNKQGRSFAKFVDELMNKYKDDNYSHNDYVYYKEKIPSKKSDYNDIDRKKKETNKKIEELEDFFNEIMAENTKLKLIISKMEIELQRQKGSTISQLTETIKKLEKENQLLQENYRLQQETYQYTINQYKDYPYKKQIPERDISFEHNSNSFDKVKQLNNLFINFFGKFDKKFYTYVHDYDIDNIRRFLISMNKRFISRPSTPIKSRNPSPIKENRDRISSLDERVSKIEKGITYLIQEHKNNIRPITSKKKIYI